MATIAEMLRRVDQDRLRAAVFALAKDPLPRRTAAYHLPGHERTTLEEADLWLEARLAEAGLPAIREECSVRAFACDRTKPLHHWYAEPAPDAQSFVVYNLYAEVQGESLPDDIIVVLAHKDSQSWIDCPGALDNAVGTAAVVEIARLLAARGMRHTLRVLLCNEEHTPWTSAAAAQAMAARGDRLTAVWNLDGLTGKSGQELRDGRKTNVTAYAAPEGRRLADLMEHVNDRYRIGLEQRGQQRPYPNDDDGSFVKAGYPNAVVNIGSFPYGDEEYHMPGDVPERVDYENLWMATQATLAAILRLDEE